MELKTSVATPGDPYSKDNRGWTSQQYLSIQINGSIWVLAGIYISPIALMGTLKLCCGFVVGFFFFFLNLF